MTAPRQQPELDEFFETRQQLTAENLCRDFHLPYFPVDSWEKLEAALPVFFGPEGAGGVLEIQTDSKVNAAFFEEYRAAVKQAFSITLHFVILSEAKDLLHSLLCRAKKVLRSAQDDSS